MDYFSEVVAHPEWVLENLAALVQSNAEGPHGVFEKLELLSNSHENPSPFLVVDTLQLLALALHVALGEVDIAWGELLGALLTGGAVNDTPPS